MASSVDGIDSRVVAIAYGVVVASLVIQGATIHPVARMSGVAHRGGDMSASGNSS